jgi:CheY-like chemotaxis protein
MIVDDHAIIRRIVREMFEAKQFEVFDAANGAEGVQKAQEVKLGLIVLDLSMPVMNGLDSARELKVLMPHIPLLMFTNNAGAIMETEARFAGISAVTSESDSDGLKQLLARAKLLLGHGGAGAQGAFDRHLRATARDVKSGDASAGKGHNCHIESTASFGAGCLAGQPLHAIYDRVDSSDAVQATSC